ncbi:unnamed protein product [Sphagnum jensenii]|uniref:Uncharacterized protein n=1 Tax=Sphagnum jensenii TaxID=128206 RepID=A0ABP0V6I2_9BRYO
MHKLCWNCNQDSAAVKDAEIKHANDCPCSVCSQGKGTKDAGYDSQKILDAVKRLVDGKAEEQKSMEDEDKASLAELAKMLGTNDSKADPDEQEETEATDSVIPPGDRQENLAPEAVDGDDEEDPEGMNDSVIPPGDRQENLAPGVVDAAYQEELSLRSKR